MVKSAVVPGLLLVATLLVAGQGLALVEHASAAYWAAEGAADAALAGNPDGARVLADDFANEQAAEFGAVGNGLGDDVQGEFAHAMDFASAASAEASGRAAGEAGVVVEGTLAIVQDPGSTALAVQDAAAGGLRDAQDKGAQGLDLAGRTYANAVAQTILAANDVAERGAAAVAGAQAPFQPFVAAAQGCFAQQGPVVATALGVTNTWLGAYDACTGAQADLAGRLAALPALPAL